MQILIRTLVKLEKFKYKVFFVFSHFPAFIDLGIKIIMHLIFIEINYKLLVIRGKYKFLGKSGLDNTILYVSTGE